MWRNRCRLPVFTIQLCPQQSIPVLSTWYTFSFISASNSRHNVFLDLPLYHFSLGFHVRVWYVMQFNDFFKVFFYPHPSGFLETGLFSPTGGCYWWYQANGHSVSYVGNCLEILVVFFIMDVVILQDSIPYDRTALMHVLKILILADSCFENI